MTTNDILSLHFSVQLYCCTCIVVQLYTTVLLYSCTVLYNCIYCTVIQLYNCTAVQLQSCTAVRTTTLLYDYTTECMYDVYVRRVCTTTLLNSCTCSTILLNRCPKKNFSALRAETNLAHFHLSSEAIVHSWSHVHVTGNQMILH
jgi:hypothetical protein